MREKVKLVFIFSLPRSGSTLLQRYITLNDRFATTPETWFLLPLISPLKSDYHYSIYSARHAKDALSDIIENNLNEKTFREIQRDYILDFFTSISKDKPFFVEKTPRNYWICEDIINIFGTEAKYIFLWRNPADIAASMIETWGSGEWNLYSYESDFKIGLKNLVACFKKHSDISFQLNYETLIDCPDKVSVSLSDYLGVENNCFKPEFLQYNVIKGKMGDPTGQYIKKKLERTSHNTLNPILRQMMFLNMIKVLKEEVESTGYSYDHIEEELKNNRTFCLKDLFVDIKKMLYGFVYKHFQPFILQDIIKNNIRGVLR